jgi:tRNA-specific 2-thiouridylase
MKQWVDRGGAMPTAGCCTVGDAEDARRVAAQLDIPYYVLDYVEEFTSSVVDRFADEYLAGRTPNPCIECNRRVRFSALLDRAAALGCDVLATGHHARIRHDRNGWHLLRGLDRGKDQSYVLHMLGQEELARIELPIGELTKDEVRVRAAQLGLRTASKPDSQDLCFVGRGDYRQFLRDRVPEATAPGDIVDTTGAVVGAHQGTAGFTVGQRRGIGVSASEPRYVVAIEPAARRVVIGSRQQLAVTACTLDDVSFVSGTAPGTEVEVSVRYRGTPAAATLDDGRGGWAVTFDEPFIGVAPGQAAVFYRGDEVLGGGTIRETTPVVAPDRLSLGAASV